MKDIIIHKKLPNNYNFSALLSLIGLFAARNPFIRQKQSNFFDEQYKKIIFSQFTNEHEYYQLMSKYKELNIIDYIAPYERFKSFGDKCTIQIDNSYLIVDQIKLAADYIGSFLKKNWMLIETNSNEQFICSNKPVNIIQVTETESKLTYTLNPEAIVVVPLSPSLTLIGTAYPIPKHLYVENEIVDEINFCTAYLGARFIYNHKKINLPKPSTHINLYNLIKQLKIQTTFEHQK